MKSECECILISEYQDDGDGVNIEFDVQYRKYHPPIRNERILVTVTNGEYYTFLKPKRRDELIVALLKHKELFPADEYKN